MKYWSKVVRSAPKRGVDPLLDDRDRLARTIPDHGRAAGPREADLVDTVGVPELRRADLTTEKRQLVRKRVSICIRIGELVRRRIGERKIIRATHILVSDPGGNRRGLGDRIGEESCECGINMRNPGPSAVKGRIVHGQDEIVLRIDRDSTALDVGGRSQAKSWSEGCRALSGVKKEVEPNRHVNRGARARRNIGESGENRSRRVDRNPFGRSRKPVTRRRGDENRGSPA